MKPYYSEAGIEIFHGDCREVLPSIQADALVTDPPYGLAGSSGTINLARRKSVYGGEWTDDLAGVRDVFVPAVRCALAFCSRGVVIPGTPHAFEYPKPDDIGAILQPASVGMSKWGACTWQPVLFYGKDPRAGLTIQRMTFQTNGRTFGCDHSCVKPDDVMRWLVGRVSHESETVLDLFMGSGTTLVAAKRLGRKAIGIEIEERYCEIAAKRLAQGVLPLEVGA